MRREGEKVRGQVGRLKRKGERKRLREYKKNNKKEGERDKERK